MRGDDPRVIGRLTKRPEFLAAASGRRFHTTRLTLQGRMRAESDAEPHRLRFGFTLTKRVGHATERNRIKRRLRAAASEAGAPFADRIVDVVVIGRREALASPYRILVEDLARGLAIVTRPKSSGPRGSTLSNDGEPREKSHA